MKLVQVLTYSLMLFVFVGAQLGCASTALVTGPASCKRASTWKDEFGRSARGGIYYFNSHYTGIGLLEEDDRVFLRTLWLVNGVTRAAVVRGTPVDIALAGGEVLEAPAKADVIGVSGATAYGPTHYYTQWAVDIDLTPSDVMRMATAGVRALKTMAGGNEIALRVPKDISRKIQTLAICFSGSFTPQ